MIQAFIVSSLSFILIIYGEWIELKKIEKIKNTPHLDWLRNL